MNSQKRLFIPVLFLVLLLLAAACSPIVRPPDEAAADTAAPTATEAPAEAAAPATGETVTNGERAVATVATRSLRVRAAPSEAADVVAGITEGETYDVLGISSDGEWVQLAIAAAPDGTGWVAANFVTVEGPITDIATVEVPTEAAAPAATAVATATAEVTTTATVTPAVAATDTVTAEVTSPVTGTDVMTAAVTPAESATVTTTELTPPAAGFALVVTDGTRLRVRSEPNAEAEIVGYVYNGETHQVLETSADGLWVRIAGVEDAVTDNPDGGWVATEFLLLGQ